MKAILLISTLLFMALPVGAAPKPASKAAAAQEAKDPVKAFQAFIASASTPKSWTVVGLHPHAKRWVKFYLTVGDVKYDVKKTDSMVNPYLGLVNFPVNIQTSEPFDTEAEAEASSAVRADSITYLVDGIYQPTEKGWAWHEFKYKNVSPQYPLKGTEFKMDRASLEKEKASGLGLALQRWVLEP